MVIKSIKTPIYQENQDLFRFLERHLGPHIKPRSVVAITSKLMSISEKNKADRKTSKLSLIKREADAYLGSLKYAHHLTIKNSLLCVTAGIDTSNSESDDYLLLPKQPFLSLKKIHQHLSRQIGFKDWGAILTDSVSSPLRRGVTGTSIAFYGFVGTQDLCGKEDLFGQKLKATTLNKVDALAAAAVYEMGEANERKPLSIISQVDVEFKVMPNNKELYLSPNEDIYAPLYIKDKQELGIY